MRLLLAAIAALALLPTLRAAEETRLLKDPEGRLTLTVPASYKDEAIAGTMIMHARASGSYGGHILTVFREEGQGDVDKQRDRYMEHDMPGYPGADLRKQTEPFFGYRIFDEAQNRVLLRAFYADGNDGIIIAVMSRFQAYDLYAKGLDEIVASFAVSGGGPPTASHPAEGAARRLWDSKGDVSLVVPHEWKPLDPDQDGDVIFAALKGSKAGPRLTLHHWGGPSSAALVLTRIYATWKRSYANVQSQRLGDDPPRMLVRERIEGSVDYIIGLEHRGNAYTLTLTVREGSYEGLRPVADDVARSVVFSDSEWRTPEGASGDAQAEVKGLAVVHAPNAATSEKVAKALAHFEKQWSRIGVGDSRKAPPLDVLVVPAEEFAKASDLFGRLPTAYDLATRRVVAVEPPADKAALELWQGQLYASLTEAILHRDVKVGVPPWLRTGLATMMEVVGRTGKTPEEPHPVLAKLCETKTSTNQTLPLESLMALTNSDFRNADKPDVQAFAWGYCHLMNYGRTGLGAIYKRWLKELEKATSSPPPLDLGKYPGSAEDLARHAQKNWAE